MADLTASLAGLTLPNPLMTASGCAATRAAQMAEAADGRAGGDGLD